MFNIRHRAIEINWKNARETPKKHTHTSLSSTHTTATTTTTMKNKYRTNFKIKFRSLIFSISLDERALAVSCLTLDMYKRFYRLLLYHFVLDMCITCYVWPQYDEKCSPALNHWNMKYFCDFVFTTHTARYHHNYSYDLCYFGYSRGTYEKCLCTTNTINALIYVNKRKQFYTNKRAETNRQMKNISMMFWSREWAPERKKKIKG